MNLDKAVSRDGKRNKKPLPSRKRVQEMTDELKKKRMERHISNKRKKQRINKYIQKG